MSPTDLSPWTGSQDLLHNALLAAGSSLKNGKYFCPFHDDGKTPNGSVKETDGRWRFKCFSCGKSADYFDVMSHLHNKPVNDIVAEITRGATPPPPKAAPQEKKEKPIFNSIDDIVKFAEKKLQGTCTQRYKYSNPETQALDIIVLRIEQGNGKKEFWQAHPVPGGYQLGLPPNTKRPLYNRARLRDSQTVILVEGEKCVHALHELGIVATTSLGGVNGTAHTDWSPLAGKTIILWPDHDPRDPKSGLYPGLEYIKGAADQLKHLNPEPYILTLNPELLNLEPTKQDAYDYIHRERTAGLSNDIIREQLLIHFRGAKRHGASAAVIARIQAVIDGTFVPIPFAYPQLSRQTRALLPGTVTIIGGTPGSGKSWFALENVIDMHDRGITTATLMLEENHTYWVHRAMVFKDAASHHFDEAWVQANPEAALGAAHIHAQWMDNFGKTIHTVPHLYTTMEHVVKWVEEQAAKQTRVIVVDPITLAVCEGDLFREELKFLSMMKAAIDAAGASLILVTHPKQGNVPIGMNAMAGSSAYQRACQTILWMEHLDEDTEMIVKRLNDKHFGKPFWEDHEVQCNRRLWLLKTRNSSGHGLKLAFHFFGKTMNFAEQGLITSSTHKNKAGA